MTSDNSLCLMTHLPDSVLLNISSYSSPTDVYNLAQTCSDFHRPSTELSNRHILSPEKECSTRCSVAGSQIQMQVEVDVDESMTLQQQVGSKRKWDGLHRMNRLPPPPPALNLDVAPSNVAKRMLKESLIQGLVSVSKNSNASISIEQAKQLAKFQIDEKKKGRSVLISGSTMVQTVTGNRFNDYDLDIYCSKKTLPKLRTLLSKHFGMVCQSALPWYGDFHSADIHHVESYIIPNESTTISSVATVRRRYWRAKMAQLAADEDETNEPWYDANVDMSYINKRNEHVYDMQRHAGYRFPRKFPITLSPKGNGPKAIDIIVCESSPQETIDQFDIEICKCTFDGDQFEISSYLDTFNLRTTVDEFTQLLNHYTAYFFVGKLALTTEPIHIPYHGVPNNLVMHIIQCFLKAATEHDCKLPLLESDNAMLEDNTAWRITPLYFLKLHNKLMRQLQRVMKYVQRGIDVTMIDDAVKARFLS